MLRIDDHVRVEDHARIEDFDDVCGCSTLLEDISFFCHSDEFLLVL